MNQNQADAAKITVFVTSHFHDSSLLELRTTTDIPPTTGEPEKRQRTGSASGNELRKRKAIQYYAPLRTLDSLTTISPIQNTVQIEPLAGRGKNKPGAKQKYCLDFLIASGNHVKSYLNFAASAVPLIENPCKLAHLSPTKTEDVHLD